MQARNPLWDAIEAVKNGTLDPNKPDAEGNSLIFQVIATSNAQMLNALLDTNKVDLKVKNSDDQTPVQYCNAMAEKIGAQRKQDNFYISKMDNFEQIDVSPAEYQRLQEVRKQQSTGGDEQLADSVFRSMRQSILVKAQVIAEVKPAQSTPDSIFVERKNVSKTAQDLVTQMQIINQWAKIAEKSYRSFIYETDPEKKKSLEAKAINHVTKFCNLMDKQSTEIAAFKVECAKAKSGKDELAYVSSAYKEYIRETLSTKDLEQKLNINTAERQEKAKQDASPLLPPRRGQSDPVPSKTKPRSSTVSENPRVPARGNSDPVISAKEGNSTKNLFKNIFKNQSPDTIRNDLTASAEAASKESSPKTEKAQPAAASPEAAHKSAPSPASEQQQETVQSPGLGRK